jgi:hypothetical protein
MTTSATNTAITGSSSSELRMTRSSDAISAPTTTPVQPLASTSMDNDLALLSTLRDEVNLIVLQQRMHSTA